MKTKLLYGFLMSLLLLGCQKEDELSPSYADRDWLAVKDDPNNPLTHLRYLIYTEQGVPIIYNDTLGSEIRYDREGKPFTYYEILKVGYTVSSMSKPKYALSNNESDVMDMVELMDEYLFEYLPKGRRPLSYLLVDTMFASGKTIPDSYYTTLTTTCVGRIAEVKNMTDSARKSWMAELAGLQYVDDVIGNEANENLLIHYDSVVMKVVLDKEKYAPISFTSPYYGARGATSVVRKVPEPELFGLLRYLHREETGVYSPAKQLDKASYIGLILSCTDEEILERYKERPLVIKKYWMMRAMMKNAGILEE